jgi:hypothetical protein
MNLKGHDRKRSRPNRSAGPCISRDGTKKITNLISNRKCNERNLNPEPPKWQRWTVRLLVIGQCTYHRLQTTSLRTNTAAGHGKVLPQPCPCNCISLMKKDEPPDRMIHSVKVATVSPCVMWHRLNFLVREMLQWLRIITVREWTVWSCSSLS